MNFADRSVTPVGALFDELVQIASDTSPEKFPLVLNRCGIDVLFELARSQQVLANMLALHRVEAGDVEIYGWLLCALADISMVLADVMQEAAVPASDASL